MKTNVWIESKLSRKLKKSRGVRRSHQAPSVKQRPSRSHKVTLGFLLSALLLIFSESVAYPQQDSVRAALDAPRNVLMTSVTQGDAGGVARLFTVDAKVIVAGFEVISGREAIQKFWQAGLSGGSIKGLILTPADLAGTDGETPVETGTYKTIGEGAKELDRGNYVIVWKRENGDWRIHRDIACTSLPKVTKAAAPFTEETAPAPTVDRVGFPKDYRTTFKVLGVPARATDASLVMTAYGNNLAASVTNAAQLPYPNGSVIVMEFARALKDSEDQPLLDSNGQPQKGEVHHVDVMSRGKDFGEAYGLNRSGEWEFAGYNLNGTYTTPVAKSASCAQCHQKAGTAKDFVFPLKLLGQAGR